MKLREWWAAEKCPMRHVRQQLLIVALVTGSFWLPTAKAACWRDPQIASLAESVARRHFARVAAAMPDIAVCEAQHFPAGVGGDYTPAAHRIRIPTWQTNSPDLVGVLAHELGHAEVAVEGGDDGLADGHGASWMRAMVAAGFEHEARRIAGIVPGAADAFARASIGSGPIAAGLAAARRLVVCQHVQIPVWIAVGGSWVVPGVGIQRICREELLP